MESSNIPMKWLGNFKPCILESSQALFPPTQGVVTTAQLALGDKVCIASTAFYGCLLLQFTRAKCISPTL